MLGPAFGDRSWFRIAVILSGPWLALSEDSAIFLAKRYLYRSALLSGQIGSLRGEKTTLWGNDRPLQVADTCTCSYRLLQGGGCLLWAHCQTGTQISVLLVRASAEFKVNAMSTRQQQPTTPTNASNQFSGSDRHNSGLNDPTVVYDRAAQERAIQERAAHENTNRESFQQGYVEGRERAAKDYANLSAQLRSQPDRTGSAGTTLGILFGILMTAVIGGSIAASFYFDGRIDALRAETENLNETLAEQDGELEDDVLENDDTEDGNPFGNLFQREEVPETPGFESAPAEQPTESFPSQVAPEPVPTEPELPQVGDVDSDVSGVPESSSEVAE